MSFFAKTVDLFAKKMTYLPKEVSSFAIGFPPIAIRSLTIVIAVPPIAIVFVIFAKDLNIFAKKVPSVPKDGNFFVNSSTV